MSPSIVKYDSQPAGQPVSQPAIQGQENLPIDPVGPCLQEDE